MTLAVTLRKMVHRKSAEYCNPLPVNTLAGGFFTSDKSDAVPDHTTSYFVGGVSAIYNYNADQDGWQQLPNSGLTGTFGAGACGEFRAISAPAGAITNTASGGAAATINTSLTAAINAKGCKIRVVAGTGAGYEGTILRNTLGANSVITVTGGSPPTFDATTQFQMFVGSLWFFNPGAGAVGFGVYDRFTNAWTSRSVTGLPTTFGTDGQLISTGSATSNNGAGFVNGTATSGGASTLTDTTKTWPVNGFTNYQVRIKSGTGLGQVRTIASNTANALTVSSAWTTQPDATSVYVIEGNDNYLYLLGNNAVTLYRYSISGNSWSTLAPGAARAGASAAGGTADWVDSVADWVEGQNAYANHYLTSILKQNGRYIFCFRGGATSTLDVYDIAGNTWISAVPYGYQMETFTTGSCSVSIDGVIYLRKEPVSTVGRMFRFDVSSNAIEPFTTIPVTDSTGVVGSKMIIGSYKESGQTLRFLFTLGHTIQTLLRYVII